MRRTKKNRKSSLGGSDAGAVMGLNPYQSAFDCWWSKVSTEEDSFTENKYTYFGKLKEAVIGVHYARRHQLELIESPKRVTDERDWLTGTPDRLLVAPDDFGKRGDINYLSVYDDPVSGRKLLTRGLEIKTALMTHDHKWHPGGTVGISDRPPMLVRNFSEAKRAVPMSYWFQCQWYCELMDFDEWDLCVLLGSSEYKEYRLLRDREYMELAVAKCEDFWKRNVLGKVAPPMDWGKSINKYLEAKHGQPSEVVRDGTVLDDSVALNLKHVAARMKELIDREKELKELIASTSGEHFKVRKELDRVRADNDALCNWFRDRIGPDLGVSTASGIIKWAKSGDRARTLRKTWKD